ncbi:MAG: hypothetical protein RL095_2441 [Verrucomicrobiota bacterium]|jgi:hypothetical protein
MAEEKPGARISVLSHDELILIMEQYRRRRLRENLFGPSVSTGAHLILLVCAAVFLKGTVEPAAPAVVITAAAEQAPRVPPPPPPPPLDAVPPPEIPSESAEAAVSPLSGLALTAAEASGLESVDDGSPSTDEGAATEIMADVKAVLAPSVSSKMFGGRGAAGRAGAVARYGGSMKAQVHMERALSWLAKVQSPDGSWGSSARDGITGLALLSFLAHGETPSSKFYGRTVERGIRFLAASKGDGNSDPHLYSHAIKTYALCEAFAMTGNYSIEEAMNACVRRIIAGQQKEGGFDYGYKQGSRDDLSFAAWNFQALKAAKSAGCGEAGLQEAVVKAVANLKRRAAAGFTYCSDNPRRSSGLRAAGILCLQLFDAAWDGQQKPCAELEPIWKVVCEEDVKTLDWNRPPEFSMYAWYYGTYACFQEGGSVWAGWRKRFEPMLVKSQSPEGFWIYPGRHHVIGDDLTQKVQATAFSILMISVYYRFLPSSKGKIEAGGKAGSARKNAGKAEAEEVISL